MTTVLIAVIEAILAGINAIFTDKRI